MAEGSSWRFQRCQFGRWREREVNKQWEEGLQRSVGKEGVYEWTGTQLMGVPRGIDRSERNRNGRDSEECLGSKLRVGLKEIEEPWRDMSNGIQ